MRKFYLFLCVEILLVIVLVVGGRKVWAQSGHAEFNGFVAFEGLAYVDKQPTAKVMLIAPNGKEADAATVETDEHGIYHFKSAPMGDFVLRITAPGYKTYETEVYIPSDFMGNLGIKMKKAPAK